MARKPRIHFPGALYHVICRGNNREKVFENQKDKSYYLQRIKHYKARYGFKLYAYAIMDNHVHLLIEVDEVPLSKIMQGIQQTFTMYYNRTYKRTGHVFEQRYKALLCNKESYLLMLIRYIHQNPLKAGFKEGLNYQWSSHKEYLSYSGDTLIDRVFPLKMFGDTMKEAVQRYLSFMDVEEELDFNMRFSEFEEETKKHKLEASINIKKVEFKNIVSIVLEKMGVSVEEIKSLKRSRNIADARKIIVILGVKYSEINGKAIADYLNVDKSFVSKTIKEREEGKYLRLEEKIKRIEVKLVN